MIKTILKKAVFFSVRLVAIVAVLGFVYGLITMRVFTSTYAFTANLWVGVTILIGGLLVLITPTFLFIKKSRLIDHTTYGQRYMEERERKGARAYELIFIGLFNISITGAVQLIVWFVRYKNTLHFH